MPTRVVWLLVDHGHNKKTLQSTVEIQDQLHSQVPNHICLHSLARGHHHRTDNIPLLLHGEV